MITVELEVEYVACRSVVMNEGRKAVAVVGGRQEYRGRIVKRGRRNVDEGGRRSTKNVAWFKISKARERGALPAIRDEDLGFGGETVAGKHVDQVLAGESWNARRTHQVDVDESEVVWSPST